MNDATLRRLAAPPAGSAAQEAAWADVASGEYTIMVFGSERRVVVSREVRVAIDYGLSSGNLSSINGTLRPDLVDQVRERIEAGIEASRPICQVAHRNTELLVCENCENYEDGGVRCEVRDPGHAVPGDCRVGEHTIEHALAGNGWTCEAVDAFVARRDADREVAARLERALIGAPDKPDVHKDTNHWVQVSEVRRWMNEWAEELGSYPPPPPRESFSVRVGGETITIELARPDGSDGDPITFCDCTTANDPIHGGLCRFAAVHRGRVVIAESVADPALPEDAPEREEVTGS